MPARAENVPVCGFIVSITGALFVPSIIQGAKVPVSNPGFTTTFCARAEPAAARTTTSAAKTRIELRAMRLGMRPSSVW